MAEKNLIITCMKNEAPFILEWIAYHRSIGFTDFLVFTNDCDDGTVELLDCLADHGVLTRADNPYLEMEGDWNPQKGALRAAEDMAEVQDADWIMIADVDEYVNIHVGDGTLDALFEATGEIDLISMQWRLFGNSDIAGYKDAWVTEQFTGCAPKFCPAPVQAWAVKTLFRTEGRFVAGRFKHFGIHRPADPGRGATANSRWMDGCGRPVLKKFIGNGWRFGTHSAGYDLVTLNHYAVRSAESFVVKRDRGRVNHVDRDQGLAYWLRMNFNMERDDSIQRHLPRARAEYDRLLSLRGMKTRHATATKAHRAKIKALLAQDEGQAFFAEITSPRMQLISRHLNLLNRQIFSDGPAEIPEDVFHRIEQVPDLMAS